MSRALFSSTNLSLVLVAGSSWVMAGCECGGGGNGNNGQMDAAADVRRDSPIIFQDGDVFEGCASLEANAEGLPASVAFVIDTSRSMNCLASNTSCNPTVTEQVTETPDPNDSRYDVLRNALVSASAQLPTNLDVAIMNYPRRPIAPDLCIPEAPLLAFTPVANNPNIAGVLSAVSPSGSTPTHDALLRGFELVSGGANQAKFVVLATDGGPTHCVGCQQSCEVGLAPETCVQACNIQTDSQAAGSALQQAVAARTAQGIRTFIIGIPGTGSGFNRTLSRLAVAGGTARAGCNPETENCHFDLSSSGDLAGDMLRALQQITGLLISCTYDTPPRDGSFDATLVNVRLNFSDGRQAIIPRNGQDGWEYINNFNQIQLYGAACTAALGTDIEQVQIVFGCPTIL